MLIEILSWILHVSFTFSCLYYYSIQVTSIYVSRQSLINKQPINTHNAVDDILRPIPLKRCVTFMLPARQGCVYTWRDGETISGITSTQ